MSVQVHFGPFRLDAGAEKLWLGAREIALRPKAFSLLCYLMQHPGRLIPQAELAEALWHHPFQSDGLLRGYIRELRHALGDDAHAPRFIETAHGRGHRFIAPVTTEAAEAQEPTAAAAPKALGAAPLPHFVGRDDELAWLRERLERALQGQRQLVWVSGEPGIGKTALVSQFVAQALAPHHVLVARGQCIEQHGHSEPYLPVLDALGRLARGNGERQLAPILRRYAPSWLAQLPALAEPAERARALASTAGSGADRVMRELVDALDALAAQQPLMLWFEDLHWCDASTTELLAMLARRIEPARLLVMATYRPAEVATAGHPLKSLTQELRGHGLCAELALRYLTGAEVARYLGSRFALDVQSPPVVDAARGLHRRTDGVPLFLVAVVDDLIEHSPPGSAPIEMLEDVDEGSLPDSLRQLLERQIERLDAEERYLLSTASVAGMEFSAALLAAVAGVEPARVEMCCERLAGANLFLRTMPPVPGAERRCSERYRFRHALHHDALHHRLAAPARRQLHCRIGEWKEAAYGRRSMALAAELAEHFERGGDIERAVRWRQGAAQQALMRTGNREARPS